MWQSIHWDFHDMVKPVQFPGRQPQTLVADDQHHFAREAKFVNRFGIGCLLQTDECVAIEFELLQNRRQSPMDFELHRVGPIPGNSLDDLGRAASNNARHPATASGSENVRDVDVATQRSACDNELARLLERARRKMP